MTQLTERFAQALSYASRLHEHQFRKKTEIPYISHPLRVAGLALEFGADEDTAIAAVLHDAVEDQGGMKTAIEIQNLFGKRVAGIVLECSDSIEEDRNKKADWKERKLKYIKHLETAGSEARLISVCDKLDNLSTLIRLYSQQGENAFNIFKTGKAGYLWYLNQVVKELKKSGDHIAAVAELHSMLDSFCKKVHWNPEQEYI